MRKRHNQLWESKTANMTKVFMKCDAGCNLIHYSMNNGLNEVFGNFLLTASFVSYLEQTTVQ